MVSDDHCKKSESAAICMDADSPSAPRKPGQRIPITVEMLLGAAMFAWFIGYVLFVILTTAAHRPEAQIDQVQAARGIIETP